MIANRYSESTSEPIVKILLVDDLRVIREQLKSILEPHRDLQIIGVATDGASAIEQLAYLQPDLILLDLDMPGLDGMETIKIITQTHPQIKVIILSSLNEPSIINNALALGAIEYIIKDRLDLKFADRIRSIYRDRQNNVVEFNRFSKEDPASRLHVNSPTSDNLDLDEDRLKAEPSETFLTSKFSEISLSKFTAIPQTTLTKLNDWSDAAKELIDTMPLPWTRGLLYFLVAFLAVSIPWAFLYQMDEIGTARGRLEAKGNTIKREADIEGSVAVLKVYVKKGDSVKAGQTIMELDGKNVREQIYQNQLKIDGEQQRLNQLMLMKNQVGLGTNAQQQQNQAQQLEKQSQIAQAQQSLSTLVANSHNQTAEKLAQLHQAEQTLSDRQSSYNLQKAEKLTQVRQAEQAVIDAQTSYVIAQNRLKEANNEVNRYDRLYQTGAIAEIKAKEIASVAQERNQLFSQAVANLQQAKLRVKEQQENYQKLLQQAQSDIAQARLRLKEQQENYQRTFNQTQADIAQAKLRLTEQQRGSQSLAKTGNVAILQTDRQLKEIESQIVTLKSEIERDRAQSNFLKGQLAKYTIKANTDGTIFELPIDREGAVVQPKQLIAEIASNTTGLVFKGEIPATQSESLRSSVDETKGAASIHKDVKLKFDEFPFESYDVVKGKLTWISPNSKITPTPGGNLASYEIEVQLAQSCVKHEGNCIPFKSGQPATAEIVIRNRRIIDFVLDPFKKLGGNDR